MTGEIPFRDKLSYFSLRIQTVDHKMMGYNGKFRLSLFLNAAICILFFILNAETKEKVEACF